MTEEKIIEVLDEFSHRNIDNWEGRLAEDTEGLGEEKPLLIIEAYAIVKELLKIERMRELVESYLKRRRKVIVQSDEKYIRVVGDRDKRKAYVWQERNDEGEILPVESGLTFQEVYDKIVDLVGPYFHYTFDEKGILVREYND